MERPRGPVWLVCGALGRRSDESVTFVRTCMTFAYWAPLGSAFGGSLGRAGGHENRAEAILGVFERSVGDSSRGGGPSWGPLGACGGPRGPEKDVSRNPPSPCRCGHRSASPRRALVAESYGASGAQGSPVGPPEHDGATGPWAFQASGACHRGSCAGPGGRPGGFLGFVGTACEGAKAHRPGPPVSQVGT